jgi:hypothetical protein
VLVRLTVVLVDTVWLTVRDTVEEALTDCVSVGVTVLVAVDDADCVSLLVLDTVTEPIVTVSEEIENESTVREDEAVTLTVPDDVPVAATVCDVVVDGVRDPIERVGDTVLLTDLDSVRDTVLDVVALHVRLSDLDSVADSRTVCDFVADSVPCVTVVVRDEPERDSIVADAVVDAVVVPVRDGDLDSVLGTVRLSEAEKCVVPAVFVRVRLPVRETEIVEDLAAVIVWDSDVVTVRESETLSGLVND